jgi:HK97 family phage portal protein
MRLFGFDIARAKGPLVSAREKSMTPVNDWRGGWRTIFEPFTGAWQRNKEEKQETILCYPTLYACLDSISSDIGKLPFTVRRQNDNKIWVTVRDKFTDLLAHPNHYQTEQQFRECWLLSKLIHGNTYVLIARDNRGNPQYLYILDAWRVMPLVSESGEVFYQINYPDAANLLPVDYPARLLIIPASEIIHDRMNTFHHQLIGVPPICAAHWPAVKNLKILKNSTDFFTNGANPGGILTAPAGMSDKDAEAVKAYWNNEFSNEKSGNVAVIGADMKFTSFAFKSADSQMVEQMRYSDEQICQPFGVAPFIVGIGSIPAGMKADDMMGLYYQRALQKHIEAMEALLNQGLGLSYPMTVELDLEPLLRMDPQRRAEVWGKLANDGVATPNESRLSFNLAPLDGGDTVYMQQQDYPLDQVRQNKIAAPSAPPPEPSPETPDAEEQRTLRAELWQYKALQSIHEALHG